MRQVAEVRPSRRVSQVGCRSPRCSDSGLVRVRAVVMWDRTLSVVVRRLSEVGWVPLCEQEVVVNPRARLA